MRAAATFAVLLGICLGSDPSPAQERIAVLAESGTPVVATELLLAVGPTDEAPSEAGLAYLSARSILAQIAPALDSLGAHVGLRAEKDALAFSLIAAPDVWEAASRILVIGIFRDPPDGNVVSRERATLAAELRARTANPADAATLELDRAFFGADHPWGRPTVGTAATVERLTTARVATFLGDNFTPDRAYTTVVGPVDEAEATDHLRSVLGSVFPSPVEVIPYRSAEDAVLRDYNSVTTWVSGSYAFPETADEEALRFVGFLTADALSFSLARRSVYNVWSEVVARVGGGELRVQVVVPPEEATEWAARLKERVSQIASEQMPPDVFEAEWRRFRGNRLLSLIAPEDRAREAARQLLVHGRVVEVVPDLSSMSQERVRNAAASLGSPTLVILGPL